MTLSPSDAIESGHSPDACEVSEDGFSSGGLLLKVLVKQSLDRGRPLPPSPFRVGGGRGAALGELVE